MELSGKSIAFSRIAGAKSNSACELLFEFLAPNAITRKLPMVTERASPSAQIEIMHAIGLLEDEIVRTNRSLDLIEIGSVEC
jgi:hypothetical protein